MTLVKQNIELEHTRKDPHKNEKRLREFESDRDGPPGHRRRNRLLRSSTRGQGSRGEEKSRRRREVGQVQSDDVFMTIVKERPLFVRTFVPETK